MINAMAVGKTDIDRLNAVLRMIAYSIEEARDLEADLFKYTLEVALSAGAEFMKQAKTELSYVNHAEKEPSIFIPLAP